MWDLPPHLPVPFHPALSPLRPGLGVHRAPPALWPSPETGFSVLEALSLEPAAQVVRRVGLGLTPSAREAAGSRTAGGNESQRPSPQPPVSVPPPPPPGSRGPGWRQLLVTSWKTRCRISVWEHKPSPGESCCHRRGPRTVPGPRPQAVAYPPASHSPSRQRLRLRRRGRRDRNRSPATAPPHPSPRPHSPRPRSRPLARVPTPNPLHASVVSRLVLFFWVNFTQWFAHHLQRILRQQGRGETVRKTKAHTS